MAVWRRPAKKPNMQHSAGSDRTERPEPEGFQLGNNDLMYQLDDIDRRLLQLLQEDDRLALAKLSKRIGVAASTLNDRIKRLVI
jgi:hypothetical protein